MKRLRQAVLLAMLLLASQTVLGWDGARLSVPVMINGNVVPYPVFSVFVVPGDVITAGFVDSSGGARMTLDGREIDANAAGVKAPADPGLSLLEIHNTATGETCRINVFTMLPASRVDGTGRLNGYRIGAYPAQPLRGQDIYLPPKGFIEVTPDVADTLVSPNFRLRQFLSKQESGYPKYLVLRASLLLKLENILATLNNAGHTTNGFVIMSGYRTPFYNRAIGNVQYSRHVWGGAADIYIDEAPADGRMDDLNGDGRVNRGDARWLADFINEMSHRGAFGPRIGGIGVYSSTSAHGPFVHVDVRGNRARW